MTNLEITEIKNLTQILIWTEEEDDEAEEEEHKIKIKENSKYLFVKKR